MKKIMSILSLLLVWSICGCSDPLEEECTNVAGGDGNIRVIFSAPDMPVIQTRSMDDKAANGIESVTLFVFQNENKAVYKKIYQYFDKETATVSMFLTNGKYKLCAVCNWSNPEQLYEQVRTWDDLQQVELQLQNPDDAFMGKYVMYGVEEVTVDANTASVSVPVTRVASLHDFTIRFIPTNSAEQFQVTEVWINNIPKGSWLVPRPDPVSYVDGVENDWCYQTVADNMANRYFSKSRLSIEEQAVDSKVEPHTQWKYTTSCSLLENRRGGLPVEKTSNGLEYNDKYWKNSKALAQANDVERLSAIRQYNKRHHALNEKEVDGRLKFAYATYMTIKGIYQDASGTSEAVYYIYLGEDSYKDYNVKRNYNYKTTIDIKSLTTVDTRVEFNSLEEIKLSLPDEVLDAHCGVVKAVLFSPDAWEVWVENPDQTPWLELSGNSVYKNGQVGAFQKDQEVYPCYKMTGETETLRNIYVHVDEYIPDLTDPMKNTTTRMRTGRIAFRKKGSSIVKHVTVQQYPAQLAVLHIKYDVHTMKEVRDTFYIERKLEKKYMPWGLDSYWSFITDDLIASGLWDGLSNTRKLYQVALFGDKWGVEPGYPKDKYPNGIPADCALGYVVYKNRDRDGNGVVDRDEIMWYFPARKEMQLLYDALNKGTVNFDGANSIFHCSTPSSADPGGITVGFSYYVNMANGKYGIGQRNRKYNVLALRRKHNEWSGPDAGDAKFTATIETGWTDEEVIMPKK